MVEGATAKIRDGDGKDLEGIIALRRIVFGAMEQDKCDPKFWRWQFLHGPDGKALIYLIDEGGRLTGHFSDVPKRFSLRGGEVLGTLSLDLMVHPDHRRKGYFAGLGKHAIRRVREEGGLFMTAYPIRQETINGLKKLGWETIAELPVLVYPIRFTGIFRRYLRFWLPSLILGGVARTFYGALSRGRRGSDSQETETEEVREIDQAFDEFWEKAKGLYPIMGLRGRAHLTWRYLRHPTRRYEIFRARRKGQMVGFIVLRKVDLLGFNSAVVVDLLCLDEGAVTALAQKGIEYGRRQGADLLGFMVPMNHDYDRMLRPLGFLRSPRSFQFMVYPQGEEEALLKSDQWYVNWGDTDVI